MQADSAKTSPSEDAAYSIYVFEKNGPDQVCTFWRRHSTLAEKKQALAHARALFGSGAYCRVEVKSRSFDPRRQCVRDRTLKCWTEKGTAGAISLPLALGVSGGMLVLLLALAQLYLPQF